MQQNISEASWAVMRGCIWFWSVLDQKPAQKRVGRISDHPDMTSVFRGHKTNISQSVFEPRGEKTGLQDFRPGLTQTRLYSQRRWPEA